MPALRASPMSAFGCTSWIGRGHFTVLDVAHQTIEPAGFASLITMDESDYPSSRAIAAFPPIADFARVDIGTHSGSRKNVHVLMDRPVILERGEAGEWQQTN